QRFAGIGHVVRSTHSTHAAGLVLVANASDERIPSRLLRRMKHCYRACSGGDNSAVRKADPSALVMTTELLPSRPIFGLILAPFGMDVLGDLRWQSISNAVHKDLSPRERASPLC